MYSAVLQRSHGRLTSASGAPTCDMCLSSSRSRVIFPSTHTSSAPRLAQYFNRATKEIDHLCRSYHATTYRRLEEYLSAIVDETTTCVRNLGFTCKGYGRRKTPYSIFEKLTKYAVNRKSLKVRGLNHSVSLCSTLNKFASNILNRMASSSCSYFNYRTEDIQYVLPDLLAATVQFPSSFVRDMNLGATKRRYLGVYNELKENLKAHIYWGPDYSDKWHINRLVFYALFKEKRKIRIPVEVFIRTDYDYYIGYANYWQYKGVSLLRDASPNGQKKRAEFLNRVKKCQTYEQVQELVFQQVHIGQMALF